ncbi:MAG TPA: molybdopterin cofactor-binding domain-containing protein, partial [Candidatus Angelobacter sp.]|nr:molybdopterin cofactor-binding domain-containing protein [Candidatus Angelobacter sp.]
MHKTSPEIGGMGHSIKRKEDLRFTQGKGNYVDDVHLPGMVYGHLVRSPYAHARLKSVNTEKAKALPGVLAIITGEDLAKAGLSWMPTLSGDKQMVLATGKVLFQSQEVAFVVAEDQYTAADAAELVEVDYEELPVLVDPHKALDPTAPILREDREDKTNHIFHWEVGDKQATDKTFKEAPVKAKVDAIFQRCHPAPLETCGCVADFNKATERLTLYLTSQAPHAHRTLFALVGGIPEQNIRVVSPDIGGGFGNKVPIYPGYVCAVVASLTLGVPVKWMETRSENLQSTGFARDYHMTAEIAADKGGKVKALRVKTLADHGAFNAAAQPTKFPAGIFSICTGSYDFPAAFCEVDGVYTNKAPGGIAYRCSFRITEAAYLIERAVDVLAVELKMDPVEVRRKNFIAPTQFPYKSALGWTYDSGDY